MTFCLTLFLAVDIFGKEDAGKVCAECHDEVSMKLIGTAHGISSAKCIDCHVEPNDEGEIADIDSKDHFCNGCHQYASVQIDCFQCHADRPQKFIKRSSHTSSLRNQLQQTLATHNTAGEEVNQ